MPRKAPPSKPKSPEADDFKSVARRLDCDEDRGRFEAKLGKVLRAPVPKKKQPR